MIGIIPWLRILGVIRFYITLVLQTVMRTFPAFILMFIFCFIWSVKVEFASQIDDLSFMKKSLEAFRESYSFTWGEDISGWLDATDRKPEFISAIWLLVAHISFLNLMISISGAVFGET